MSKVPRYLLLHAAGLGTAVAHGNAVAIGAPYVPRSWKLLVVAVPKKIFCTNGRMDELHPHDPEY